MIFVVYFEVNIRSGSSCDDIESMVVINCYLPSKVNFETMKAQMRSRWSGNMYHLHFDYHCSKSQIPEILLFSPATPIVNSNFVNALIFFHKKLRITASTASFLKLLDFECSEFPKDSMSAFRVAR